MAFALHPNFALAAESQSPAQMLVQADDTKTSDYAGFVRIIQALDAEAARLSPEQALQLRYLKAWQEIYQGKYEPGIAHLDAILDESREPTLRVRAGVTVVNALAIASHYERAYERLSQLVDLLPQVSDKHARYQGYGVAALLYDQAGQYDLALTYADHVIQEDWAGKGHCMGGQLKLDTLYNSGKLRTVDTRFQDVIDACTDAGEHGFANMVRTDAAKIQLDNARPSDAIKLLEENYADAQRTRYPILISEFDSLLAQAYWRKNDAARAREFALRAIAGGTKNEITKPLVDANQVLYQVAQMQGDYRAALAFHQQYADAAKAYLNDESTKALAFQMVHQQVQAKKLQVDALRKQNQLLELQQTNNRKTSLLRELYIALLIAVLAFIALWAYRTKRSEQKFIKLARIDSLTGILNHQHFIDAAGKLLKDSAHDQRVACVLVIDLDHFKLVNDAHGHATGDDVLKRTVAACRAHLRSVDVFGRLGGEEFGIALADCTLDMAMEQAETLRLAIACIASADEGPGFPVHASFGVAATDCSGYELRQLMAHADSALYQAKREGRNRVVVFNRAVGLSGGEGDSSDRRAAERSPG